MKRNIKATPIILSTAAFCAVVLAAANASANEFTGSVAFGASGITDDNATLSSATTFGVTGAFTTASTGEYSTLGVVDFQPVTFNGFRFNPPVASVSPLWMFQLGTNIFSFDATSVQSTWVPGVGGGEWDITGHGMASISGFSDTPGTYTVNISDSGNLSLGFDATADAAPVPDGGTPLALLGGALVTLGIYSRKFAC